MQPLSTLTWDRRAKRLPIGLSSIMMSFRTKLEEENPRCGGSSVSFPCLLMLCLNIGNTNNCDDTIAWTHYLLDVSFAQSSTQVSSRRSILEATFVLAIQSSGRTVWQYFRAFFYADDYGWPTSKVLPAIPESDVEKTCLVDVLQDWKTTHYQELIASGEVKPRPGVLELFDEARSLGLKVGVCSAATKSSAICVLENLLGEKRFKVPLSLSLCLMSTHCTSPPQPATKGDLNNPVSTSGAHYCNLIQTSCITSSFLNESQASGNAIMLLVSGCCYVLPWTAVTHSIRDGQINDYIRFLCRTDWVQDSTWLFPWIVENWKGQWDTHAWNVA